MAPKFATGQQVEFLPGRTDVNVPRGRYVVVRPLPADAGERQYRVKHAGDGHERIMRESQLAAIAPQPAGA